MHFLIHGNVPPGISTALAKRGHGCHAPAEIADMPETAAGLPAQLLPLLEKKQWNLLTADSAFVRTLYEQKSAFNGLVIFLLEDFGEAEDAIGRLFTRYPRLTPRRMYTLTPNRIKIRQLPGIPSS